MRYLESIGFATDAAFRPSKEVSESYLHIRHTLELNDVYIAAFRVKVITNNNCFVSRRIDERSFKRDPLTFSYNGRGLRLVPDGFLDIRMHWRETVLSVALLLEHDRGTEQREHFQRRIKTYKAFLSSGVYKQLLATESITVAFTTFVSARRVHQMRGWTLDELEKEPELFNMFRFAELPQPLEPKHLLFERRWYTLTSDQPIALIGE
jgi:hypothetical protein